MTTGKLFDSVSKAVGEGSPNTSLDFGSILQIIMQLLQVFQDCNIGAVRKSFKAGDEKAKVAAYIAVAKSDVVPLDDAPQVALALVEAAKEASDDETEDFIDLLRLRI